MDEEVSYLEEYLPTIRNSYYIVRLLLTKYIRVNGSFWFMSALAEETYVFKE
jgi:hypothetical protein